MFERFTKKVAHKVKDVATEEIKRSIKDSLPLYARLVALGVLSVLMLYSTRQSAPKAAMIVINTYNYY